MIWRGLAAFSRRARRGEGYRGNPYGKSCYARLSVTFTHGQPEKHPGICPRDLDATPRYLHTTVVATEDQDTRLSDQEINDLGSSQQSVLVLVVVRATTGCTCRYANRRYSAVKGIKAVCVRRQLFKK